MLLNSSEWTGTEVDVDKNTEDQNNCTDLILQTLN